MASIRVRRQLYRAVAELVEEHKGQVTRRAAARTSCEGEELDRELARVMKELHRRGGRRCPAQLDLEEWLWGQLQPDEPRTLEAVGVQLELF